ncbi:MAG: glucose-6-phosphate isomerase [Colwellia sp.]|nr:glucose-6-phosphate isomerase [Colwellia sp.]
MTEHFFDFSSNRQKANDRTIISLFDEITRVDNFTTNAAGLFLDYSKQNISQSELSALINWAGSSQLFDKIAAQFSGDKINNTEQRAVLHTLLRAPNDIKKAVLPEGANEIIATEQQMEKIVNDVCSGKLTSSTQEKFTDVLAIGIGGSFYGIKVGLTALQPYHSTGLNVHFLANVDGGAVQEKLNKLSAKTTLVVVISKTFSTQETLLNALAVKHWMLAALPAHCIAQQWFAISTNIEQVTSFGIAREHVLPIWDWVGGRFSLWSAVGLPLAFAIGYENFVKLKQGAFEMDQHFKSAKFKDNMPVIMALLGMWNRNGLNYSSLAILPYEHALRALPGYLQQTDMESNGKSVSIDGKKLDWLTAPVVFGQEGTNGQHAFMQLMHQSVDVIPTDFIVSLKGSSKYSEHHKVLVANCFAQSEALMQGKTLQQVKDEMSTQGASDEEIKRLAVHKTMKGNTPSNTIVLESLNPHSLGALLALYEHKIFVQGVLWQLNSFDQWGVELGKQLGDQVLAVMAGQEGNNLSYSSQMLIKRFLNA